MAVGGTLGILRLAIRDDDADPSALSGSFTVDINSGGNNHLTFNQLSGEAVNLSSLFTPKLNLTGKANLKLQAGVTGSSGDPASDQFFSALFPTLRADFNLLWNFDQSSGIAATCKGGIQQRRRRYLECSTGCIGLDWINNTIGVSLDHQD
jgi:hypothetical protein